MNIKYIHTFKNIAKQNKRGFTLVEMLIIAPIVVLLVGVFVSSIVNMTGDVLATRGGNTMTYDIQDALDRITQDVQDSNSLLATNSVSPLTSPQGFNNDTTDFHNADPVNGNSIILKSYATTKNPLDPTADLLYISGQPYACSDTANIRKNPVLTINTIYFVKDKTLWRRVVMPSSYATAGCNGTVIGAPWQRPSCATAFVSPSYPFCKASDIKLVEGIQSSSDFAVEYFATPGSTTPNLIASDVLQSDATRQTNLKASNTVSITINATQTIAGRDVIQSGNAKAVSPNN